MGWDVDKGNNFKKKVLVEPSVLISDFQSCHLYTRAVEIKVPSS